MRKWLFGALLLANTVLFLLLHGSSAPTGDKPDAAHQELNAEKIELLQTLQPASAPTALAVPSAPVAASPVAAVVTASAAVQSSAPSAIAPKVHDTSAHLVCLLWGEFGEADRQRAKQMLEPLKLGDRLSVHSAPHAIGYWVYLTPQKKQSETEQQIAMLKTRGLGPKDYFLIQDEGEWSRAVSLGFFKSKEAAQSLHASLKAKGVTGVEWGERMGKAQFSTFGFRRLDSDQAAQIRAMQKKIAGSVVKTQSCD